MSEFQIEVDIGSEPEEGLCAVCSLPAIGSINGYGYCADVQHINLSVAAAAEPAKLALSAWLKEQRRD